MGIDARVTVDGVSWEVEPDMAGEKVIILWGLFDDEMVAERSDRIRALASQLNLPVSALLGNDIQLLTSEVENPLELQHQPFDITELEYHFPTFIAVKLAIAWEKGKRKKY